MSGNGLTESVCSLLASAIPRNLSLRELTLSGNKIAGPPFHDMITALSSPTCKMEKLELSNTGLTDDFSPRLAFLISNNHFLKEIGLSDNALEGPHFGELMRTLASPECRLEHMSLTIDDFTENSCSQLMSAITGNQSLRQFSLCSNNMDESQFGALLTALSSPKCSLSRFIFVSYGCHFIYCSPASEDRLQRELFINLNNAEKFSYVIAALYSPTCKAKDLSVILYNNTDYSIHALPGAGTPSQTTYELVIHTNTAFSSVISVLSDIACRMERLNVKSNILEVGDYPQLTAAIGDNQSLRTLILSGTTLVASYFSDLVTALSRPTCRIEELMLQETSLGNEHLPMLASLSKNLNFTHVDLSCNHFSDAGYHHIETLIQSSASLKKIRVDFNNFSESTRTLLKNLECERPGLEVFV